MQQLYLHHSDVLHRPISKPWQLHCCKALKSPHSIARPVTPSSTHNDALAFFIVLHVGPAGFRARAASIGICDSVRTCAHASQALHPFAQNFGARLTANDNTRVGITIPASHQQEPQTPSTGSHPRHRPLLKHPSSALPPSCAALSARSGPPAHADPAGVTQTQP